MAARGDISASALALATSFNLHSLPRVFRWKKGAEYEGGAERESAMYQPETEAWERRFPPKPLKLFSHIASEHYQGGYPDELLFRD
mmetsp:Transcript_48190/g.75262  ORF Transcript_48190/g.75262 Transcript_48190/m.75262 type:complete len:86 (-) Transcript_48190:375-632(-)